MISQTLAVSAMDRQSDRDLMLLFERSEGHSHSENQRYAKMCDQRTFFTACLVSARHTWWTKLSV